MKTPLSKYIDINFCQCQICPRKKYETGELNIDFINICCYCGGQGGNYGNVYHIIDCPYSDCIHSNNYYKSQQFKLFYHNIKRVEHCWTSYQPNLNTRIKHSKFSKYLKKHILDKILDLDKNLYQKAYYIINLKTKHKIFELNKNTFIDISYNI